MPREHGKDGAFVETVSLEDVLDVFDAVDGPAILSADVSDELECSRETARRKLEALHERGDLARRKVSRRVIYWRPDQSGFDAGDLQGDPDTTLADESPHTDARAVSDHNESERPDDDTHATHAGESGLVEDVRAYLKREDIPPKTAHGRDAVIDVFQYLREHGTASTGEIQDAVYPDYTEPWGSARSMWESIKRGFEDTPGIEKAGYGEYRYTGDEHVREELEGNTSIQGGE
jgi:hypothetical protein